MEKKKKKKKKKNSTYLVLGPSESYTLLFSAISCLSFFMLYGLGHPGEDYVAGQPVINITPSNRPLDCKWPGGTPGVHLPLGFPSVTPAKGGGGGSDVDSVTL